MKNIICILFGIITFGAWGQVQSELKGKVMHGDTPLDQVTIIINQKHTVQSDDSGAFLVSGVDGNTKPTDLMAYSEGFELSTWNFSNELVSVYMRPATIKFISGSIDRLEKEEIHKIEYKGKSNHTVDTDSKGTFQFKIPFDEILENDKFYIDGQLCNGVKIEEDKERNQLLVSLPYMSTELEVYSVAVSFENGKVLKEEFVQINDQSFLTSQQGKFKLTALDTQMAKWSITNENIVRIDTISSTKTISVILKNPGEPQVKPAVRDTHAVISLDDTTVTITGELSHGINHMNRFYSEQEEQLKRHNDAVMEVHNKLAEAIEFNDQDHKLLTSQLQELTRSIENTSKVFNETREINMAFVLELRNKLEEKDQTIKEKNLLITQIQNHMFMVITVLLGITLLLVLSVWTIRRFKAQNRVIERTKRELLKVQEMAKIGGMTYDSNSGIFDYSENFHSAMNIADPSRIKKLNSKTNGIIPADLIDEEDLKRVQDAWKEGMSGKNSLIDIEFKGKSENSEPIYIDMRTRFERNNLDHVTYISSSLQDISRRKKQEFKLRKALVKAEEASKAKEEFLAAMSHEIRTPLNAIIGLTDHIIDDKPKTTHKKHLEIIQGSGKHLLSLLNDVLDFSKIKAGKIEIEQTAINLKKLIEDTVKAMSLSAESKGIALKSNIDSNVPSQVLADKLRINQILINLISNAVKFTSEGDVEIIIRVVSDTKDSCDILFSVKDTGMGIAADKLETIFRSFEQEDSSTSRKFGGTGLGLAICKQLVELMNGELKVKSQIDQGSEFFFTLSLPKVKEKSNEDSLSEALKTEIVKLEGLKVLCVEDNEINQMVVEQYFRSWSIDVTFAGSGEEALRLFGDNLYDMVFMDIRLPDMSGYDITRKLREKYPDRNEPILAFTAEIDESTSHKILEAGMLDFVTKPFSPEDIVKKILKYLPK